MAQALTVDPVQYTGRATSRIPRHRSAPMSDTTADSPPLNVTDMPKVGIAWGDDISEERKRDLDALLAAWDTETDHSDRIGPFDVTGLSEGKSDQLRLTGADVFYLAARALVGARPKIIVSTKIKPIPDLDAAFAALHDPDMRSYCDLSYLNLGGADLQEAQLAHAYLLGANLTATDLYQANLERANLAWIQLERAELLLARLERAQLTEARLERAMFVGAILKNATLQFAHLTDTDLSEADFEGADLHGADLQGADLHQTQLADADLRGAVFSASTESAALNWAMDEVILFL